MALKQYSQTGIHGKVMLKEAETTLPINCWSLSQSLESEGSDTVEMTERIPSVGEMAGWLRREASLDSLENEDYDNYSDHADPSPGIFTPQPGLARADSGVELWDRFPERPAVPSDEDSPVIYFRPQILGSAPDLSEIGVHKEALTLTNRSEAEDDVLDRLRLGPNQHATLAETEDVHGNRQSVYVVFEDVEPQDQDVYQPHSSSSGTSPGQYINYDHPQPHCSKLNETSHEPVLLSANALQTNTSFVFIKDEPSRPKAKLIKIVHIVKDLAQKAVARTHFRKYSNAGFPEVPQRTEHHVLESNTGLPTGIIHPDVLGGSADRQERLQLEERRKAAYRNQQKQAVRRQVVGTLENGTTLTLFINAANETAQDYLNRPLPPLPPEAFQFDVAKQTQRKPAPVRQVSNEVEVHLQANLFRTPHRNRRSSTFNEPSDTQSLQQRSPTPSYHQNPGTPTGDEKDISDILRIHGLGMSGAEDNYNLHNASPVRATNPTQHNNWPMVDDTPTPKLFYDPQYSESINDEINRLYDLARLRRLTDSEVGLPIVDTFLHGSHVSLRITEHLDRDTVQSHYTQMPLDVEVQRDTSEALWRRLEEETGGVIRNTKSSSRAAR